jgi:hypothetical protein
LPYRLCKTNHSQLPLAPRLPAGNTLAANAPKGQRQHLTSRPAVL